MICTVPVSVGSGARRVMRPVRTAMVTAVSFEYFLARSTAERSVHFVPAPRGAAAELVVGGVERLCAAHEAVPAEPTWSARLPTTMTNAVGDTFGTTSPCEVTICCVARIGAQRSARSRVFVRMIDAVHLARLSTAQTLTVNLTTVFG